MTDTRATIDPHPASGSLGEAVSFVAGRRVEGTGTATDVVDPYTGRSIGVVRESGTAVLDAAVVAAHEALPGWSALSPAERGERLLGAAAAIHERGADLAALVTAEMGMPIALSRVTQWALPAAVLRAVVERSAELAWTQPIDGAVLHRRAAGVVAAISPWNMPVYQTMTKLAGALMAGCTAIVKPSVQTPFDAQLLVELLHEGGVPSGVIGLVQGQGSRTGDALAGHRGIAHVSFTGSVDAGRHVAARAAGTLARCTLELGGKSPIIVLPDADHTRAVPAGLASGTVNAGQACNATTRMLVHVDRMAETEALLADAASRAVLGDPAEEATTIGPLSSERHGRDVLGFVRRALDAGGRLVVGTGERADVPGHGFVVAPTVIADLDLDAEAVQEEIFGPVIALLPYRDLDDAVRIAHATRFGLSAEIWGPEEDAVATAERLRVGQVKINGVRTRERPSVPFGGVGESGYGRELGVLGIEEFTQVTAVMA